MQHALLLDPTDVGDLVLDRSRTLQSGTSGGRACSETYVPGLARHFALAKWPRYCSYGSNTLLAIWFWIAPEQKNLR